MRTIILILTASLLVLGGCSNSAVRGGATTIAATTTTYNPDGSKVVVQEQGQASGAEATASGDGKLAADLDTTAPKIVLSGGQSVEGSGVSGSSKVTSRLTAWGLIGVGIMCLLGSGAAVYFGLFRAGCILAVGGVGLIVVGLYPGLLFILIAVGAIAGGVYLYAEYRGKSVNEALRAVVAGVATAPDDVRAAVKAKVAEQADARDKRVIADTLIKDNL